MMPIGSNVIYDGGKWINAVKGTQPVWGVQEFPSDDEDCLGTKSNEKELKNKSFSELLKEAMGDDHA